MRERTTIIILEAEMLVTLANILNKADQGNYAVVAPDYTSMETVRFQLEIAEKYKAPLILSYTKHIQSLCPVRSWEKWIRIILDECNQYDVDVCLHLDHGTSLEECQQAIEAGFSGIMIDASAKPFDVNAELTSRVVEIAHAANVSVEAEIGHVGMAIEGTYLMEDETRANLTQPDQAEKFVSLTGTDCLAVAIGTVHGEYIGEPHINFELLKEIDNRVQVPLVIHGGSGTGDDNIKKAISLGIRKINVFSDWIVPAQLKTAEIIGQNPKAVGKIADQQRDVIYEVLLHWFDISGSINKG
jgi:ketose-bisphosphate aldolase